MTEPGVWVDEATRLTLTVVAHGEPIGQGRVTTYGPGRTTHSNKSRLLPWRDNVRMATRAAMVGEARSFPWDGPVILQATFTVPKPKATPKGRPAWPSKRPDLSHLVRAVEDALTDAGAIDDDSRIVEIRATKTYVGGSIMALPHPGVVIDLIQVFGGVL